MTPPLTVRSGGGGGGGGGHPTEKVRDAWLCEICISVREEGVERERVEERERNADGRVAPSIYGSGG